MSVDCALTPSGADRLRRATAAAHARGAYSIGDQSAGLRALLDALESGARVDAVRLCEDVGGTPNWPKLVPALTARDCVSTLCLGTSRQPLLAPLQDEDWDALARYIAHTRTLTDLLTAGAIPPGDAVSKLATALQRNTTLATISLDMEPAAWGDCAGNSCIDDIASALVKHPGLRTLRFVHCRLTPHGGDALVDLLARNTALTALGVVGTSQVDGAHDAALASVIRAVGASRSVRMLDLSDTHLGPQSVAALADALRQSAVLTAVNIGTAWMSRDADEDNGLACLCAALRDAPACMSIGIYPGPEANKSAHARWSSAGYYDCQGWAHAVRALPAATPAERVLRNRVAADLLECYPTWGSRTHAVAVLTQLARDAPSLAASATRCAADLANGHPPPRGDTSEYDDSEDGAEWGVYAMYSFTRF